MNFDVECPVVGAEAEAVVQGGAMDRVGCGELRVGLEEAAMFPLPLWPLRLDVFQPSDHTSQSNLP